MFDMAMSIDGEGYKLKRCTGKCTGCSLTSSIFCRDVCDTGHFYTRMKERIGCYFKWDYIGPSKSHENEFFVLHNGILYKLYDRQERCTGNCDANGEELCRKHCAAKNDQALCVILRKIFPAYNDIGFKRYGDSN